MTGIVSRQYRAKRRAHDRADLLIVVSVGGLVEIVPLFFQKSTTEPVAGLKPYTALQLAGRDVYIREGCYTCHSQMIRPFRAETERYGHFSVAGESVYDHPFQWGSKRTGPDLHAWAAATRTSGIVSTSINPATWCPSRTCPAYPWLAQTAARRQDLPAKMRALRNIGVPYTRRRHRRRHGGGGGQERAGCPDRVSAGARHLLSRRTK